MDNNVGTSSRRASARPSNCIDPDLLAQRTQIFTKAKNRGMTVFASSGDSGAAQFTCDGNGAVQVGQQRRRPTRR